MELFFNKDQEIDIKNINKNNKVIDFLSAITNFLEAHPLDCFNCNSNCCSRDWNIELDIIFYNRLLNQEIKYDKLKNLDNPRSLLKINSINRPVFNDKPCYFLGENNLCQIYEKRPFICRGYICYNDSDNYKIFRDTILDSLNLILLIKLLSEKENKSLKRISVEKFDIKKIDKLPFHDLDYNIKIIDLIEGIKTVLDNNKYESLKLLFIDK
ncbi:MAG: YkgJ family cysteine cluster protein [Halanaerobiales bacterium]